MANVKKELRKVSDEELKQVTGGEVNSSSCRQEYENTGTCPDGCLSVGNTCLSDPSDTTKIYPQDIVITPIN